MSTTTSAWSTDLYNAPCMDVERQLVAGLPESCRIATASSRSRIPIIFLSLRPMTLTRGGSYYGTRPHRREGAGSLHRGPDQGGQLALQPGPARGSLQRPDDASQTEPRVGIAYNIKPTSTVLSVSYARTLETPFNENLVLSSSGCSNPVLAPLLACTPGVSARCTGLSQRVPCRPAAGLRQDMPCSAANTSGSTRTTPSTSACWATRPSPSPSTGTTQRFPAMRSV